MRFKNTLIIINYNNYHYLEPAASYPSEEDSTEPYVCMRLSSVRNEVFTTLDVICPKKKGIRKTKPKADTGAAANTLRG